MFSRLSSLNPFSKKKNQPQSTQSTSWYNIYKNENIIKKPIGVSNGHAFGNELEMVFDDYEQYKNQDFKNIKEDNIWNIIKNLIML